MPSESDPTKCPFCNCTSLSECVRWAAVSEDDPTNSETLVEWQCTNCARSFWV